MSDPGTKFVSDKSKDISKKPNIEQVVSSYQNQSNRQIEACIKFIKCARKKSFNINADINLS